MKYNIFFICYIVGWMQNSLSVWIKDRNSHCFYVYMLCFWKVDRITKCMLYFLYVLDQRYLFYFFFKLNNLYTFIWQGSLAFIINIMICFCFLHFFWTKNKKCKIHQKWYYVKKKQKILQPIISSGWYICENK